MMLIQSRLLHVVRPLAARVDHLVEVQVLRVLLVVALQVARKDHLVEVQVLRVLLAAALQVARKDLLAAALQVARKDLLAAALQVVVREAHLVLRAPQEAVPLAPVQRGHPVAAPLVVLRAPPDLRGQSAEVLQAERRDHLGQSVRAHLGDC